jgi:hypothetical protein
VAAHTIGESLTLNASMPMMPKIKTNAAHKMITYARAGNDVRREETRSGMPAMMPSIVSIVNQLSVTTECESTECESTECE